MSFAISLPRAALAGLVSTRQGEYRRRDIVLWWEHRRIYYNLILLPVGLLSIFVFEWIGSVGSRPDEDVIEPMVLFFGIPLFALCANLCYSFGSIADLVRRKRRPSTTLLVSGFLFSIFVTLVPALYLLMFFVFHRLAG